MGEQAFAPPALDLVGRYWRSRPRKRIGEIIASNPALFQQLAPAESLETRAE
jgi:hypothetical protein